VIRPQDRRACGPFGSGVGTQVVAELHARDLGLESVAEERICVVVCATREINAEARAEAQRAKIAAHRRRGDAGDLPVTSASVEDNRPPIYAFDATAHDGHERGLAVRLSTAQAGQATTLNWPIDLFGGAHQVGEAAKWQVTLEILIEKGIRGE